jgi:hypothetical protein
MPKYVTPLLISIYLDVFVHFIMFQDAFASQSTLRSVGHEGLYLSLAEFPFAFRWDVGMFPAIVPLSVYSTKSKDDNDPNFYFRLQTESIQRMSRGVLMYSAAHGRIVKAFGLFHSLFGDVMGRAYAAGRISPTFGRYNCPCCTLPRELFLRDVREGVIVDWRDSDSLAEKTLTLGENPEDREAWQDDLASRIGMNFYTELLKWPGTRIVDLDALDLMHCELGGESMKHVLKFLRLFHKTDKKREIWVELSNWIRRKLKSENIREFSTEASF